MLNFLLSNSNPRHVSGQGSRRCQIRPRCWSWESFQSEPSSTCGLECWSLVSSRKMINPRRARSLGSTSMRCLSTAFQSTVPVLAILSRLTWSSSAFHSCCESVLFDERSYAVDHLHWRTHPTARMSGKVSQSVSHEAARQISTYHVLRFAPDLTAD